MPDSTTLYPAFIGAGSAIATILIKDLAIKIFFDYKAKNDSATTFFQKYADPLTTATMKLLWRYNEILEQHPKSSYLLSKYNTSYVIYKRRSTTYRIASLLGLLRAFETDLAILNSKNNDQLELIKFAMGKFHETLADGNHIEKNRLEEILNVWKFNFKNCTQNKELGSLIDGLLNQKLSESGVELASELPENMKIEICTIIADEMCDHYRVKKVPHDVIQQTSPQIIQACSMKECWLYRDWQDAIGTMMMQNIKTSSERIEIIGYYDFEKKYENKSDEDNVWFQRIENLYIDLDISGADKADARHLQLIQSVIACSKLFLSLIDKSDDKRKLMMAKTSTLAKELIEKYDIDSCIQDDN